MREGGRRGRLERGRRDLIAKSNGEDMIVVVVERNVGYQVSDSSICKWLRLTIEIVTSRSGVEASCNLRRVLVFEQRAEIKSTSSIFGHGKSSVFSESIREPRALRVNSSRDCFDFFVSGSDEGVHVRR